MKQPVYKNRIETILEEKKEMNDSDKHFFQEINGVKEKDLTEQQKERINMIYVGLYMDIPKIIKEHHQAMIDKGFYDCPQCNGDLVGYFDYDDPDDGDVVCGTCGDKMDGIDPDKNIGELLMLIVSELSEALEAHRTNHFCPLPDCSGIRVESVTADLKFPDQSVQEMGVQIFEAKIKDTFEDEIADVFLRLFDLCGYLDIEPSKMYGTAKWPSDNIADKLRVISKRVINLSVECFDNYYKDSISTTFLLLHALCSEMHIPIEKHIYAKMAYNKSRPHKHGKEY